MYFRIRCQKLWILANLCSTTLEFGIVLRKRIQFEFVWISGSGTKSFGSRKTAHKNNKPALLCGGGGGRKGMGQTFRFSPQKYCLCVQGEEGVGFWSAALIKSVMNNRPHGWVTGWLSGGSGSTPPRIDLFLLSSAYSFPFILHLCLGFLSLDLPGCRRLASFLLSGGDPINREHCVAGSAQPQ